MLEITVQTEDSYISLKDNHHEGVHTCDLDIDYGAGWALLDAAQCRELASGLLDFADRLDGD